MKVTLFSFTKPTPSGRQAHIKIANYLSKLYEVPCLHDDAVGDEKPDLLLLVAGAFAFCGSLAAVGAAVQRAGRVVWVQNDYTIAPPKAQSAAESPFRAAFRVRAQKRLPAVDYWTTVKANATATARSAYVNWNALAYEPLTRTDLAHLRHGATDTLLYYGAFRANREEYFDRYFTDPPVPVVLSGSSKKWDDKTYKVTRVPTITDHFTRTLASHGLGLYLGDKKSHHEDHSPSTRFYEMLGAGLPMVFQPEAVTTLGMAGYDVSPWMLNGSRTQLRDFMRNREAIGAMQRQAWTKDYPRILRRQVRFAQQLAEK
jgi:hypothetical protein